MLELCNHISAYIYFAIRQPVKASFSSQRCPGDLVHCCRENSLFKAELKFFVPGIYPSKIFHPFGTRGTPPPACRYGCFIKDTNALSSTCSLFVPAAQLQDDAASHSAIHCELRF